MFPVLFFGGAVCQDNLTDGFQNTRALCPTGQCWCSPQKLWIPADPQLLSAQCAVLALKYSTRALLLADGAFHLSGGHSWLLVVTWGCERWVKMLCVLLVCVSLYYETVLMFCSGLSTSWRVPEMSWCLFCQVHSSSQQLLVLFFCFIFMCFCLPQNG